MPSTLDFVKRPRNWGFVLSNGFLGSVPECDLPGGQIVQHHIIVLALSQENAPCRTWGLTWCILCTASV